MGRKGRERSAALVGLVFGGRVWGLGSQEAKTAPSLLTVEISPICDRVVIDGERGSALAASSNKALHLHLI